ncbi:MAG TPA: SAM-dependent methyltransferase [Pseudonocardiaceae bacterium]|jgi:trans-aconitate methyltransferase|nr:SAM-dependent methyltransferase [Pseudonocardiaceae bacterium]
MADDSRSVPPSVDVTRPNPARIYDYLLGGAHNFAIDRQVAEQAMAAGSVTPLLARLNRSFLRRAVRYMISEGIDQFLDLGSGIPTAGNVHEIAQAVNPDAKVVYVDSEAVAVAHARHLLEDNPLATIIQSDIRDVAGVLSHPDTLELLDLDRPVGVLTVAVFHFIPDSDRPADLIRGYLDPLPVGSHLAISHYTRDGYSAQKRELARKGNAVYQQTGTTAVSRSRDELAAMLTGLELVAPGIVWTCDWRPDGGDPYPEDPTESEIYAAVGRTVG